MARTTDEDRLVAILRDVKDFGGVRALAEVAGVSYRTLYRHAQDDAERPELAGKTRRALVSTFAELTLLEGYDDVKLATAMQEVERLAMEAREARAGRALRKRDLARGAGDAGEAGGENGGAA